MPGPDPGIHANTVGVARGFDASLCLVLYGTARNPIQLMTDTTNKLKARLPRGFVDRTAGEIRAADRMLATIRSVYERYGFEPVETPLIEYTDALGKFLPDLDRPNEGVFSFQDDDEQWLSLRYDLTAPLARYVAENFDRLPKPFRSYRAGWVFRNEKPGPGRFRQFMQFDADTVGARSPAADAEICMMAADTLEELGIQRGQYVIKVNSRKVLDGVLEAIGLAGDDRAGQRLSVLRAIDKLDRLGIDGVRDLLGAGRRDDSGDFTKGAGLSKIQTQSILKYFDKNAAFAPLTEVSNRPNDQHSQQYLNDFFVGDRFFDNFLVLNDFETSVGLSSAGRDGVDHLREMIEICEAAGYGSKRVRIDPSVVRGLEYYTGAVFEAELLFETVNDKGEPVRFGSVGGGGRYDGLVGRFRGDNVPATGFSIGVSRLMAALAALERIDVADVSGPVVVLVMDRARIADSQRLVGMLRNAGIASELYLGESGMKAQMKYADRRNSPAVVIQGEDERSRGVVQIKDLALGKMLSAAIADNAVWREERPGQFEVAEADLVTAICDLLERQ